LARRQLRHPAPRISRQYPAAATASFTPTPSMNPRQAVSPVLSTKQGATGHTDTKDINPIQPELKVAGNQKIPTTTF
jgi:hypothetical protein